MVRYVSAWSPRGWHANYEIVNLQIDVKINDLTDDDIVKSIPFSNKMLAFRAMKHGLRFSHNNWRMWANYMIVSMNVGELFEAARALGRVVEETSDKVGAQSVDEDVLERLVDHVPDVDVAVGERRAVMEDPLRRAVAGGEHLLVEPLILPLL